MAKRKRLVLTSEWLAQWKPSRSEEVADKGCKGLSVIGGPSGIKTFYRFESVRDPATGKAKRQRVRLGHFPALSLVEAQAKVGTAREKRRAELPGAALSVIQLAESYRKDVLQPNRTSADETWETIRLHILEAQPDPRRPPFGEWLARDVEPLEVAAVVRLAKEPRMVGNRRLGGTGAGRLVLREVKSIFAHGVETGALRMTPAGTFRARAFGLGARTRSRYLDANEVRAFFDALDLTALLDGTAKRQRVSPTVRLGLAFQLYVPLRSHSLIGARWEEFDVTSKRWTVPVERLKLHPDERAEARPFEVPLPGTAVTILERLREEAGESRWVLASPGEPEHHVEPKALIRALTRLQAHSGRGAKVKPRLALGSPVTVHDLRRTWRTWALELGVDHVVAERSLGHVAPLRAAGFSNSADIYARGQMVEQRAGAMERVAAALDRVRLGQAAQVVPLAEART